jgi:predicted AAA+ superfamily ATPase
LELTILRDVAVRKGIRETKPLADLSLLILSEPGKTISSTKTADRLGISQPTFRSFVDALNDAFLILSVQPYVRSPRERLVADAKHYAFDVGLQKSVSISTQDDFGRRVENVVAVELVRRGYSLSYLKSSDCECDFIAQKIGSKTLAIQVWSGEGELPAREVVGLKKGVAQANAEGLLLTLKPIDLNEKVNVLTVEEWLMQ